MKFRFLTFATVTFFALPGCMETTQTQTPPPAPRPALDLMQVEYPSPVSSSYRSGLSMCNDAAVYNYWSDQGAKMRQPRDGARVESYWADIFMWNKLKVRLYSAAQSQCGHTRLQADIDEAKSEMSRMYKGLQWAKTNSTTPAPPSNDLAVLSGLLGAVSGIAALNNTGSGSSGNLNNCRQIDATCIINDPNYQQCMALPVC